jgi:hypothetical protein
MSNLSQKKSSKLSEKSPTNKFSAIVLDTFEESQSRIAGVARRYHNSDLIFLYENHAIVYALVNKVMKQIASEGYHWVDGTGEQVENSET